MIKLCKSTCSVLVFLIFSLFTAQSQVKLPRLISDGMVLQQNAKVKIWGWATTGEKVSVAFLNATYSAVTDAGGKWSITLPPMKAGGPYTMVVSAKNSIEINDIMIGEVWLCSGQSNMELPMRRVSPLYEKEIAASENKFIRQFTVPQKYNFKHPEDDLSGGNWKTANPETVLSFSAVAYFFAKELYDKYKVPVGLINASLGGSPAEAWMSEEALKQFPHHLAEAQRFKDDSLIAQIEHGDNARIKAWYQLLQQKDEGYKDPQNNWRSISLNTNDWNTMLVPGYWADTPLGPLNGVVWFRKKTTVPAAMAGKQAKLILGRIVDADSVFVNGVFVGTTSYQYPPRRYEIPANVLKEGENLIVVRVINSSGRGGFVLDKPYEISSGDTKIDLKGEWQYKLGASAEPLGAQTFIRWKPVGLFNGMIHPLLNYRIKGAIWYQGESNAGNPGEYKNLFPAMITDWRTNWEQGNFPFLFVQLPNFMEPKDMPSESNWAQLREAQRQALSLPNTGMAVAIDLGEWNDIHPLNKKDVGKRLALVARKVAYKEKDLVASGPLYQSMTVKDGKVVLSFTNLGGGLIAKGGALKYFAIAGIDNKFSWANAEIKGDKVVVWSEKVQNPVAVRYAWADNPVGAGLYNKEGLPASPFQADK